MKKHATTLIVLFVALFTTMNMSAQKNEEKQKIIAKFHISDGSKNGQDVTPHLLEENAQIVFYRSPDIDGILMANFWGKSDSQSYGPIYGVEKTNSKEDTNSYEADLFVFNWRYINTYDDKKGTAKVKLLKVYKPQGVYFELAIIPENLDVLVYRGYMEGTLDLAVYERKK